MTMKRNESNRYPGVLTLLALGVSAAATVQADTLEEIVVTATKRPENVQDIPISVSAFSGDFIESSGIETVEDLGQFTPNLYISKSSQAVNQRIAIRGVGTVGSNALEPSVAVYVDGVYIPRPGALLGSLQDIASVEVLRGPQGTLFGRNASVGAINITTNRTTDTLEGKISTGFGHFGSYDATAVLNAPLGDQILSRFSLTHKRTDGFGENHMPGQDEDVGRREESAVRGTFFFPLGDTWEGVLRVDYQELNAGGTPIEILPETLTPETRQALAVRLLDAPLPDLGNGRDGELYQIHNDDVEDEQLGASTQLEGEIGAGHLLRLISSYRDWDNNTFEDDVVRLTLPLAQRSTGYTSAQFTQEIVFLSPESGVFGGKLDYVAGLFYSREDYSIHQSMDYSDQMCSWLGGVIPPLGAACAGSPLTDAFVSNFEQESSSYAVFGQLTWHLSENLHATGGARYTEDEKTATFLSVVNNPAGGLFSGVEDRQLEFSDEKPDWFANLKYFINENVMAFATVSTGYKAGGFNGQATRGGLTGEQRTYDSEDVINYEVGTKATFLEGSMQANFSLFRMEIENFQDRSFDGFTFLVTNAAELRQQGAELDVQFRPIGELTLSANLAYLDSEFTEFNFASNLPGLPGSQDLKGHPNHYAPEYNAFLAAEWRELLNNTSLEWFFRNEFSMIGEANLGATTNANPQTIQDAYDTWNVRSGIGGADGTWQLSAFIENVNDEEYCTTMYDQPAGALLGVQGEGSTAIRCVVGQPRTAGIKANYYW